ncbi:hypothetical protein CEXT_567331 [Caerostris extrusa]|uniref:Uncharacterized protein n=1 Tax=Caerostris extrusa TaxID=172846 RepID=A0AAV4V661_CAEEX|nr:hypothetical protein CEXT_567331 [Caerostris extrusa]
MITDFKLTLVINNGKIHAITIQNRIGELAIKSWRSASCAVTLVTSVPFGSFSFHMPHNHNILESRWIHVLIHILHFHHKGSLGFQRRITPIPGSYGHIVQLRGLKV